MKRKLYEVVKDLLSTNPGARNSDKHLIWMVWSKLGLTNPDSTAIWRGSYDLAPTPESITRAGRKVREQHPELGSDASVQAAKDRKEQTKGTFIYREEV